MNQSGFNQRNVIRVLNVVHMVTLQGTKKKHVPRNGKAGKKHVQKCLGKREYVSSQEGTPMKTNLGKCLVISPLSTS